MRIFLLLLLVTAQLFALKKEDVRVTLDEMFHYHVEHKELTPLLIRRSIKLYIEQFDHEKLYLLGHEILPFLETPQKLIEGAIALYNEDNLSFYQSLNKTLAMGIARAQTLRDEIERELILNPPEVQETGGSYLTYPKNEKELRQRIKKQLVWFLLSNKSDSPKWNPSRREKIFTLLEKRLNRSESTYLGKDEHYLVLHTLKALAKSLDSHTAYFSPEEAQEMRTSLEKQFEGIGIGLKEGVDGIVVTDVINGGPAAKSGKILKGDLLVSIDGKSLKEVSYDEVLVLLKSEGKQDIALGLKRRDENIAVTLTKEKILMQKERLQYTAEPYADGYIGKITLPSFYEGGDDSNCEKDMKEAIKALKKQGPLYGLVIDLRYNSGGFLNQAVKVAGLFITSGVIVISKYSQGEVQYLRTVDGRSTFNGPVIILTSKASASAAEIVAQALQDYGAALVVGDERTYGKGTIQYQTVTDTHAKAYFKVTVGKYYTVSGKSTQIEGVKADVHVPTEYSRYNIGERFLEYPLTNDQMPPAFTDPVTNIKSNYPQVHLRTILPDLQANSSYRLEHSKDFQTFLASLEPPKEQPSVLKMNYGVGDLQMNEAVLILKDMIFMNNQ